MIWRLAESDSGVDNGIDVEQRDGNLNFLNRFWQLKPKFSRSVNWFQAAAAAWLGRMGIIKRIPSEYCISNMAKVVSTLFENPFYSTGQLQVWELYLQKLFEQMERVKAMESDLVTRSAWGELTKNHNGHEGRTVVPPLIWRFRCSREKSAQWNCLRQFKVVEGSCIPVL